MRIRFQRISDERHRVSVVRADGSTDARELHSRSFLRHDLAHFAVERELGLTGGYWGCVAAGARLSGAGVEGAEAALAEALAGPVQTLLRLRAGPEDYAALVARVAPEWSDAHAGARIHERARRLQGRWRGTPFHAAMALEWPGPGLDPG